MDNDRLADAKKAALERKARESKQVEKYEAEIAQLKDKVKELEQSKMDMGHVIRSLEYNLGELNKKVESYEALEKDNKAAVDKGEQHGAENHVLRSRIQVLESEAEEHFVKLKESRDQNLKGSQQSTSDRLRVSVLEDEVTKLREAAEKQDEKYNQLKAEYDEFAREMAEH